MTKSISLFSSLLLIIVFTACRKDDVGVIINPYKIEYPAVLAQELSPMVIPNDNPMSEEGVALGKKLFYDNILSADGTQSCASCHSFQSGFTDTARFSTGIDGIQGNRNSMPLINIGWAEKFFWDGRANSLEAQALEPVVNPIEMHHTWPNAIEALKNHPEYPALFIAAFNTWKIDSTLVAKALAQFERTLLSGNSPVDRWHLNLPTGLSPTDEAMMIAGYDIFRGEAEGDCLHCHGDVTNPLWTDNEFHNNGLDAVPTDLGLGAVTGNPIDNGKFKTPTLRNLLFTAPYMHDGRFKTLEEVIEHYSTGLHNSPTIDPDMKKVDDGGVQLNPFEKELLLKFLECLTDSSILENPNFQP